MPRIARLIVKQKEAVYHVMSRTALHGYVTGDVEKDFLLHLTSLKYSSIRQRSHLISSWDAPRSDWKRRANC
jgi:hypothetical protein